MIRRFVLSSLALAGVAAMAPRLAMASPDTPNSARPSMMQFGRAVAISGDWAFVGEPGGAGRPANPSSPGQVWVFRRGLPAAWRAAGTLTLPAKVESTGFGSALATDGSTLLVGHVPPRTFARPGEAAAPEAPGMVHVYTRGTNGFSAAGVLPAPTNAGSRFGTALALVGDMAYVGAPGQGSGVVHVFRKTTSGWSAAGMITADGLDDRAGFGSAISLDGDRIAIGATGQDGKGGVYVFAHGTNGAWTMEGASALESRRSSDNAQFGATVLLKGDKLMVGAPGANFIPEIAKVDSNASRGGGRRSFGGVGMVVTFERNPGSGAWVERGLLTAYDFPAAASFGSDLAMVGNELWVGAPSAGAGEIYRVGLDPAGQVTSMGKLMVDSVGRGRAQFGANFAVSGSRAIVGMPGDISGEGTILFLDRAPGGTWRTVGSAFPPTKDRFEMVKGKEIICENGKASAFDCSNTGLLAFLPTSQVGGGRGSQMSDNWGYTDAETGREYALAGRNDGTGLVDITDPENPVYLGNLPLTAGANPAAWRDIKVYKHYMYVVADGAGQHGMQVFDLNRLRGVKTPQTFEPDYVYTNIASAHNIVINEETGFAYGVGGSAGGEQCGGGLHMMDLRPDPVHPKFVGCAADSTTGFRGTGYSHDAVCIVYHGPDTKYQGHELCMGSNENAISLQDVTDKKNPKLISTASYPFVAYAHQGWFTEDHKYFYLDDESDEIEALKDTTGKAMAAKGTRTMIYDVTDLDDPILVKEYIGTVKSSDHNLYIKGNKAYLSNYGSGLRIADITDPTNPREVAYLDTYPQDENEPHMVGAWSVFPYFKSGTILITSVSEGLFLVKDRSQAVP